jgi:multidrug efflux system membrane fusion protein
MIRHPGLLFLVGLLTLAAGCRKEAPPPPQRPPAPVTVAEAVSRPVPVYLDEVGRCVARETVSITPQVSGRVTEILFTDGADVKKGEPLFTIDPRPFAAQVHVAEANLAQAKAALDLARSQFARVADLVDSKAMARQDYDTRKNTVTVDEAVVQQQEAALEAARLNLEYTSIRSPIEGRAGKRLIDIGNVVMANTTAMLSIERLDPIYTDFTVTENDMSAVQRGMSHGALKVEVRLPGGEDHPLVGAVTFTDNTVQDATGTLTLRATIPNPAKTLWPGRFVKVRLVLSTMQSPVLIPITATQTSAKGAFVYVMKDDITPEIRPVTVGQRQGDLVVIDQGISAGERVVTAGQLGIAPNAKVKIVPSGAPGGKQ